MGETHHKLINIEYIALHPVTVNVLVNVKYKSYILWMDGWMDK